jgi:hypothetical protein
MSVHDAEPRDVYVDENGKLWRVTMTCGDALETELVQAFACGHAYARNRDHRDCPEFEALEKKHGFK